MKLPSAEIRLLERYAAAFPLWTMPAGPPAEERARQWTIGFARQSMFSLPELKFGSKKADATRPLSKDAIAQEQDPGDPRTVLLAWDLLSGAGSGSPTLNHDPDAQDITGQVFFPVTAHDSLGGAVDPPAPPPPPAIRLPSRAEAQAAGEFLHEYYRSAEGLQRPEGLWIGGHPDWEGIGAWLFDVWLQGRVHGAGDHEARQAMVSEIRKSDEWRIKHPGERP